MATARLDWRSASQELAAILPRLSQSAEEPLETAEEAVAALERCAAEARRMAAIVQDEALRTALAFLSEILDEVATVVERTGRRLARVALDLHDDALQEIAALRLELHGLRSALAGAKDADARAALVASFASDLDSRLQRLDRGLRELIESFESPSVTQGRFEDLIRELVRTYSRESGISVTAHITGDSSLLTRSQRIALLRILAEALANVRRHSKADAASVSVRILKRRARLRVRDNGRGFDVKAALRRAGRQGKHGLAGMLERVRLLGGTLDIASQRGGPTTVTATIPAGQVGNRGGGRRRSPASSPRR